MENMNTPGRLSQSPIWLLQRQYFEEQGVEAWRNWEVPHYITNNPVLAKAYAEIVFSFFRDRDRLNNLSAEPLFLLELGGGSGRFAYYFLKYLNLLCDRASFNVPPFCYILSDLPRKNIDFWQTHPKLQPFVVQGQLDFASFDAENDSELHLIHSLKKLSPQTLTQPLVVIANYFFDSIPQDLLFFQDGKASECRVSLLSSVKKGRLSAKERLKLVEMDYHYVPMDTFDYEEGIFHELLDLYRDQLEESHLLFPCVGLHCLERLRRLSCAGLLLLSADKGCHRLEELDGKEIPSLVHHGSFSLSVNYHAFKSFYENQGGEVFFTSYGHQHLNVACIAALPYAAAYSETRDAYWRFAEEFGPDDFFSLKKHLERNLVKMGIGQLVACFRLSGYDTRFFQQCIPRLLHLLPACSQTEKENVFAIIPKIWDWHYPIGETQDLAFDLGLLLYQLDFYEAALGYFKLSLEEYGESATVYYNLGLCYYLLKRNKDSLLYLDMCLKLDPGHDGALSIHKNMKHKKRRVT